MLIVDCSEFSGIPDYDKLRAEGAEELIPRIASGPEHADLLADRQIEAARSAGLRVRAGYGYLRSWRSGIAQAEFMFAEAERRGLKLWVDFEPVASGHQASDAPAIYRSVAHDFLRRWVDLCGSPCGVYGPAYFLGSLDLDPALCGPLWVAHAKVQVPAKVRPWGGAYALHQYALNAPGGSGATRVDWSRTSLTCEQLGALLATGAWQPSEPTPRVA